MREIEDKYKQQLRHAGLFVSEPYVEGHAWEYGVRVGKPSTIAGNSIAGYDASYITIGDAPEPPEMDAPMIILYTTGDVWIVHAQESVPEPGATDFINKWNSPEEAVADILDFYFGDPSRMRAKADARKLSVKVD